MAETPKKIIKKRPSADASRKKLMDKLKKERIKNTSARASAKKVGASSDTLTQRMGDARKSRGPYPVPAVRKENAVKPYNEPKREIVKYEEPKRGVVKYEPKANVGAAASNIAKRTFGGVAGRIAGPVGALVGMATPAGAPEESATIRRDRSYGPLMRGNSTRVNQYGKGDAETGTFNKAVAKPVKPKLRPDMSPPRPVTSPAQKTAKKSDIRVAFEKEFAKKRAEAKRRGNADKGVFTFRGQKYTTKVK